MNDFWIILVGILVACACSLVGCFLVLRKMAMIGDAISHSILPGIAIAFFIGGRDSFLMMVAASLVGLFTVFLIQTFHQKGVQSDASIGIVYTALFSIGVIMVSMNARQIGIDLDCILHGEIAFTPWNTLSIGGVHLGPRAVWQVGSVFLLSLIVIGVFYKQFKICSFDPVMAAAIGIPVVFFHYLLMALVSLVTVASFESVGAILVVGMLVVPASTAYLLTERLSVMIGISMLVGSLSAVIGYYIAFILDSSIAGSMVAVSGMLFLLALLFSPTHGVLMKKWKLRSRSI